MSHEGAVVITDPPSIEPVTLAEAKEHLKITEADDDATVMAYITVARERCEQYQSRAYIQTGFNLWLRSFPRFGREIIIPRSPLIAVASVSFFTPDDAETVVDASVYNVDEVTIPGRIRLAENATWPTATLRTVKGVKVVFTAGHGLTADDVPARMRHAIKLLIANYMEQREPIIVGTISSELSWSVRDLLATDRVDGWVG